MFTAHALIGCRAALRKKKKESQTCAVIFFGASSQFAVVHTAETSNTTEGGYNSYF